MWNAAWRLRRTERADPDIAIPDGVAVVLQQDVALLPGAESRDVLELAVLYRRLQRRTFQLVLKHARAVQEMLDVRAGDDDAAFVEFAHRLDRPGRRRRQDVVERRGLAL